MRADDAVPADGEIGAGRLWTAAAIRMVAPLGAITALIGVANAMTGPFLALFLERSLHADAVRTTVFLVATPLSSVVVTTVLARLSDRGVSRRGLLLAVSACAATGNACFALVPRYEFLLVVSATLLAAGGAVFAQTFALARVTFGRQAPHAASLLVNVLRTIFSVTWVVAPPLAGLLLTGAGFPGLYGIGAACFALAGCVVAFRLRDPDPRDPGPRDPDPRDPDLREDGPCEDGDLPDDGVLVPGGRRRFRLALVAFTCLQCANKLSVQALPLLFVHELHADAGRSGLVLGLCAALEIPWLVGSGLLIRRVPLLTMIMMGSVAGMAYFGLALSATQPWHLGAGQLLNAAFIAMVEGIGLSWFQDLMPASPGRATTAFVNTGRMAALAAAPVMGACRYAGYRFAFAAGLGLAVAGLAVLALARGRSGRRPPVGGAR